MIKITPTFETGKWVFGHFCPLLKNFCPLLLKCSDDFCVIFGHLPTFCPLLKTKTGLKKWLNHAVLRVFCPLSHFFLLFNCDKKIKKYIRLVKKSGLLTKSTKSVDEMYKNK